MTKNKLLICCMVAGLAVGSLGLPAEAKKKKKKAKPVATTLFMEGDSTFGEEDQSVNGTFLKLQPEAGSGEKNMGLWQATASPNTSCGGNSLMPVFVGPVSGTVTGDMTVTFDAIGQGGQAEIRVWPDMAAQFCNSSTGGNNYVEPDGVVTIDLPAGPGTVEATIEDVNFKANSVIMVQVTPILGAPPYMTRVFYGTESSTVEFDCIPIKGNSC
ncbi:MAG: hypothetical protein ACR2KQ_04635 [Actinomycetota bacterium]